MTKIYQNEWLLRKLYNDLKSGPLVAERLGVSYKVLARYLKKYGITHSNTGNRVILDERSFQRIDTEEKAYYLGILFADCYISKSYDKLQWNVGEQDKDELHKFKNTLNANFSITKRNSNTNNKQYISYGISICNKKLITDLANQGLVAGKNNRMLPLLDNEIMKHFLRGYFDGDGYFSIYDRDNRLGYDFGYVGSYDIVTSIAERFELNNIALGVYRCGSIWRCSTGSLNSIIKTYHYLYDNATIFFERKKAKFLQVCQ